MSLSKIIPKKIFTDRQLQAYSHDIIVSFFSFYISLYLRLGMHFNIADGDYLLSACVFTAIATLCYPIFGMNSGVWRYASLRDLLAIGRAVTISILVFVLLSFLITRAVDIPRSVPLINWFVLVVLLGAPRLLYRMLKDKRLSTMLENSGRERIPLILVGAGDEAEIFIRAVTGNSESPYRIIGILDDKGNRVGREIHGIKIMGDLASLESVVASLSADGLAPRRLVLTRSQERFKGQELGALVERCGALNLSLACLPALTDFRDPHGGQALTVRPVALEDLLGRPPVALNLKAIGGLISGRTVLITGAGGTIGSELTRQVAGYAPRRLVLFDNGEYNLYQIEMETRESSPALDCRAVLGDVRDRKRVLEIFHQERPELVFHAAALKHVPMVELNPVEGVQTNILGTRNVADAAIATGVPAMVLISTDKAVRPTNIMGATKRIAETYCQALDIVSSGGPKGSQTRFMTVRFGNVLGSTGSVVPLFTRQLQAGGPLTVTHPEVVRYFMTVREAVELVLQASAYGMRANNTNDRGRIFVLDMGQPVKIVDLARQMIRLAGLRPDEDVKIVYTGLRPGEKLYEEMFAATEPPERTSVDGVLMASPHTVDLAILRRSLDELEAAAMAGDEGRLRALLQHVVPDYHQSPAAPVSIPTAPLSSVPLTPSFAKDKTPNSPGA